MGGAAHSGAKSNREPNGTFGLTPLYGDEASQRRRREVTPPRNVRTTDSRAPLERSYPGHGKMGKKKKKKKRTEMLMMMWYMA